MIKLGKIYAKDFLCFSEIEFDLSKLELCCVLGDNRDSDSADSNGSGKSSIYDLIHYLLYGKPLRPVTLDNMIRKGQDECSASLSFATSDGKKYKIERTKTKRSHKLNFYEVGNESFAQDKGDMQSKIKKTIGMSSKLFSQVTLFGQGGSERFSKLSDAKKKLLIEEILGLDTYAKASELAIKKKNLLDKSYKEKEIKLEQIRRKKVSEVLHLTEIQDISDKWDWTWESNCLHLDAEASEANYKHEKLGEKVRKYPKVDIEKEEQKIEETNHQVKELNKKHNNLQRAYNTNRSTFTGNIAEHESQIRVVKNTIERINSKKKNIKTNCPTCKRPYEQHDIIDTSALEDEVSELKKEIVVEEESYHQLKRKRDSLDMAFQNMSKDMDDKIKQSERKIEIIEDGMKDLVEKKKERDELLKEYEQTGIEIEKIQEKYGVLLEQKNPHKGKLKRAKDKIEETDKEISELEETMMEEDKKIRQYKVLHEVFGPKGIRSYLFENLLPEINDKLMKYTQIISNGVYSARMSVMSETADGELREKIDIKVHNPTGGEQYDSLSSGEKRRLDLPISFALHDVASRRGIGMNVLLLDEVFENVDESGISGVMSLLRSIKDESGVDSMLVITHDPDMNLHFSNAINIRKENGASFLVDM